MALLNLRNVHLSYGDPPLLEGLSLSIERGDRICLIGRNGEGKSTLLKVIAGEISFDDGERIVGKTLKIQRLAQEVPSAWSGKVFDLVADGLGSMAELIKSYHGVSQQLADSGSGEWLQKLSRIQHELETAGGWQMEQRVESVISRMQLDPEADFSSLSGGMKRRVLLARALAGEPDLMLLDEPTNHLDIEAIAWLEDFLLAWKGTLVFITHDRAFLRRLATRIVELDRGSIMDFPGNYENYLRRRDEMENAEKKANERFDKRLAQEEAWIRQGIKARRTRNQGRVRQLQQMRESFGQRRKKQGKVKLALTAGERSGKLVCEATGLDYSWNGNVIIRDFSTTIIRGDRIGIIGPNGCGKSTLLNLLLGKLKPQSGTVELGTRLEVAYFDQLRGQLREDETVIDNVAEGSDKVTVNGKTKHVISYLQDFLFPPDRVRQPVRALSGGERNRLLLARLFTRPANVLVLDEPTNDLDVETLELLEELLLTYEGTLLLVSHDREFLDNAVTSTLVFEGNGLIREYVGGYTDWVKQKNDTTPVVSSVRQAAPQSAAPARPKQGGKLSYKLQRELDSLPALIEELEQELDGIRGVLSDPELYKGASHEVADLKAQLQDKESALEAAYSRWDELEAQSNV